jgi:hypothetical protein
MRWAGILVVLLTTACQSLWGVGPTTLVDGDAAVAVDAMPTPDGAARPDVASGSDAASMVDASPMIDGAPSADVDCVPASCAALDAGCGTPWDRCSARLNCGVCAIGSTCVDQVCRGCTENAGIGMYDLPAATVSLVVTQDHLSISNRVTNGWGSLTLRNVDTDDTVAMGPTDTPEIHTVAKGVYDVYYSFEGSGNGLISVPTNALGLIASGVRVDHDGQIPIDMTTVTVDRTVTVNGSPVSSPAVNGQGSLALRSHTPGDAVGFGDTEETSHPVRAIAGVYDVYYEQVQMGTGDNNAPVVPFNTGTVAVVSLRASTSLHLDIHAVAARLNVTFNSMALADRVANGQGSITIRDGDGNVNVWGTTDALGSTLPVIAGTYTITYSFMTSGSGTGVTQLAPHNQFARLGAITFDQSRQYNLDVPVANVIRSVTVNGQAIGAVEASGKAMILLGDSDNHEQVSLGETNEISNPVPVITGTYDVYVRNTGQGTGANGAPVVPWNYDARLMTQVSLTTARTLTLDIPSVRVDRMLYLAGSPLSTDPGSASLELRDETGRVVFGTTAQASYPVYMVPGSYSVLYMRDQFATGSQLPANTNALLPQPYTVQGPIVLDVEIPQGTFNGAVTVNGSAVPDASDNGFGTMSLTSRGDDLVELGATYASPLDILAFPGEYDLFYQNHAIGAGPASAVKVPENLHWKLGCVELPTE